MWAFLLGVNSGLLYPRKMLNNEDLETLAEDLADVHIAENLPEELADDDPIVTGVPKNQPVFGMVKMHRLCLGKMITIRWEPKPGVTLDAILKAMFAFPNAANFIVMIKLFGTQPEYTCLLTCKENIYVENDVNFFSHL